MTKLTDRQIIVLSGAARVDDGAATLRNRSRMGMGVIYASLRLLRPLSISIQPCHVTIRHHYVPYRGNVACPN
jgi:hypothetical protein